MFSVFLAVFSVLLISANAQDCSQGPPKVNPKECCPGCRAKFLTQALAVECGLPPEMVDQSGKSGGQMGPPSCQAVTCLFNKNNVLSADGTINRQALRTFLDMQFSAEWRPAIDTVLQKCNAEADTNQTDECKIRKYAICLRHYLFLNCPASIFVSSSDCTQLKTFMDKCPPPRV